MGISLKNTHLKRLIIWSMDSSSLIGPIEAIVGFDLTILLATFSIEDLDTFWIFCIISFLSINLPFVKIQLSNKNSSINIVDLIILSKIEKSKSEIRRLIKGKGVKINSKVINDENFLIKKNLFDKDNSLKLSIGKKKHIKIKLA